MAGIAGAAAKLTAIHIADAFASGTGATEGAGLFPDQVCGNIAQLRNILFWFAFLGNFGFLRWAVVAQRRRLSMTQWLLCGMVVVWFGCMFVAGIWRELRVFGPMGLVLAWMTLVLYLPSILGTPQVAHRELSAAN